MEAASCSVNGFHHQKMSATNSASTGAGRDAFWVQQASLPLGLRLTQLEPVVVPRRGRGGETVFDLASLQTPTANVHLVIAFRTSASTKDALIAKDQLRAVINDLRLRSTTPATLLPALATEVASHALIEACVREGLGVIDRRGTVIIHGGPVYVHVEGHATVDRTPRVRLFSGKGCRIVRNLLAGPKLRFKPQEIATSSQTSYAFAHGVLSRLERDGFLERTSPRSGFQLRDPVGLLKAWLDSGERTAVRVTPYYSPNTRAEALAAAAASAEKAGVRVVFTLASALLPSEVFVSALQHGIYASGDTSPIEEALRLERTTPHNFLILRAEPAAETSAGGVYSHTRGLPHGVGVSVPQLASDFVSLGGRGREQAERLLEIYAKDLPLPELPA